MRTFIENHHRAVGSEVVDKMEHNNGVVLWWAFVSTVMNHWVLQAQRIY
jgi:hypothetical protein